MKMLVGMDVYGHANIRRVARLSTAEHGWPPFVLARLSQNLELNAWPFEISIRANESSLFRPVLEFTQTMVISADNAILKPLDYL